MNQTQNASEVERFQINERQESDGKHIKLRMFVEAKLIESLFNNI